MRSGQTKVISKGLKFRLYPTLEQEAQFRQHGGNARFLWNQMLALNKIEYEKNRKFVFSAGMQKLLPKLKRENFPFLRDSHSQSLQQVCKDLDEALRGCFKLGKGFPRFKRKASGQDSFTIHQRWAHRRDSIKIPKIGWVRWVKHRSLEGIPKSITVSQDGDQWFVSVKCEIHVKRKRSENQAELSVIGVDLGLKDLAIGSDGSVESNPHHLKRAEKKLKRAHRKLSRKKKGSKNREKAVVRLQRAYRKVRRARRDTLDKLSHRLVEGHDVVVLEDLNVKGMVRNRSLSKAISDVGWGEFRRQVTYKADWAQKRVLFVDRFFPSSKRCSSCHSVDPDLTLDDRTYVCSKCGLVLDRDLNAALNIEQEGRRILELP